jgi:hypothetical protein
LARREKAGIILAKEKQSSKKRSVDKADYFLTCPAVPFSEEAVLFVPSKNPSSQA